MKRYYDTKERRLVYCDQAATPDFWDQNWDGQFPGRDGLLAFSESQWANTTAKYLEPADGPVLEGGCGMGHHVAALRNLGFQAIGIDYAPKTVQRLNEIVPELDIREGDVRNLDFPDDTFAGYWSLGVIEHFWDGYESIADEMKRVLRVGGVLFLAFPFVNPVRRWKARLGLIPGWRGNSCPDGFFQFALDADAVAQHFEGLGFELLAKDAVIFQGGMGEEFPNLNRHHSRLVKSESRNLLFRLYRRVVHSIWARLARGCGYSVLLILQQRASS